MVATTVATVKSHPINPLSLPPRKSLPSFDFPILLSKSKKTQFQRFTESLKQRRNAAFVPVVRAQSVQGIVETLFAHIYAQFSFAHSLVYILCSFSFANGPLGKIGTNKAMRVSHVSSGLLKMGIRGVTVSDVRGFDAQGGSTERQVDSELPEDKLVAKVKMEIVVSKDRVNVVPIMAALRPSRTIFYACSKKPATRMCPTYLHWAIYDAQ